MRYTFSLFIIALLTLSLSVQAQTLDINTVAGNGTYGFLGDGNVAIAAEFAGPIGIAFDSNWNYYVIDYYNYRIRKITASDSFITTVAGTGIQGYTGDNGISTSAEITAHGIAIDKSNNVYFSDPINSVVRKITPAGIITRVVGTGILGGYSGDGGPATAAEISNPYGLALDSAGNLYIADMGNHVIRMVTTTGIISTVVGIGTPGYTGDLGPATAAQLDSPYAVTVDNIGRIYISDHRNNVIRRVDTTGDISTFAGTYGVYSYLGDGGQAALATINGPAGLLTDSIRNLYICDADNNVIRKVDTNGIITTIIGVGVAGYSGDLGPALGANLHNPYDIKMDRQGSFYIADANNERIRKVYSTTLGVNTVVGVPLDVHPNPFTDHLTVTGLNVSDRVSVSDMTGRLVAPPWTATTTGTQTFTISEGLAPGLYLLCVSDAIGNSKAVQKLVKQ